MSPQLRAQLPSAAIEIRAAVAEDAGVLAEVLFEVSNWDGRPRFTREQLAPSLYLAGWPRAGDFGVIAQTPLGDGNVRAIGAAWCRTLSADAEGYGYVADDIPELTIGVLLGNRGAGVGRALLEALILQTRSLGHRAISLSVEDGNRARELYDSLGFTKVGRNGGSDTLLLSLDRIDASA